MREFSHSLEAVVQRANSAVDAGNIETALRLIHDFVERIFTEPLCTGLVFSSRKLDALCMTIGRLTLRTGDNSLRDPWPERKDQPTEVYIISRLQRTGGHSRLVRDFISTQPGKNHLIISSEVGGPSDKDYFDRLFSMRDNVRFLRAPQGNLLARLQWMQATLVASRPERTYLLNHHQDSVAVSAVTPDVRTAGCFVHHGDHHLCLGVHLGHLTHIDLHPMGYGHCRQELGVDNVYLPLTVEDQGFMPMKSQFGHGGALTTATAAGFNKLEVPYHVSYLDAVVRILKETGGTHVHIGKLSPWGKRKIYREMRKLGIPEERFVYHEWVPSVWKTLQDHSVDLYIASFPYGAGLTLIEAMGAGIPVVLHRHVYSRVLSCLDLAYPSAFSWAHVEELLEYLKIVTPDDLRRDREIARQRYERYHSPAILSRCLSTTPSRYIDAPTSMAPFEPRWDEWAATVYAEVGFRHVLRRYAYRTVRKIRNRFT